MAEEQSFQASVKSSSGERKLLTVVLTGKHLRCGADAEAVRRMLTSQLEPVGLTVESVRPGGDVLSEDSSLEARSFAMVVVVRGFDPTEAWESFSGGSHDEVRFIGDPWEVDVREVYDTADVLAARTKRVTSGPNADRILDSARQIYVAAVAEGTTDPLRAVVEHLLLVLER